MKKQLFILMMMMLTALTTQAAEYGIRIAGVQVTDENKGDLSVIEGVTGTATYDSEANVLSLTDVTIDFEIDNALVIDLDELTIEVTGNNTMNSVDGTGLLIRNPNGHVTLTGSGMLRAVGQDGVFLGQASGYYGAQHTKLTVRGPMLIAQSNNAAGYGIRGAQNGSYAGYGELELVYGTIRAKGTKGSICQLAAITVYENATVELPENGKIVSGEVQTMYSTTVKDAWVEIVAPKPDIETPLTIEAVEDATVTFSNPSGLLIGYKVNDGEMIWTSDVTINVTLASGEKIEFYGNNETYYQQNKTANIKCSAECYIYGNVMSLIQSSNFGSLRTLTKGLTFYKLFYENRKIKDHPTKRLLLPATKLSNACYSNMFAFTFLLKTPPELPAMELAQYCYQEMFRQSGITSVPQLPATTLAESCYSDMFFACSYITEGPDLPAPVLVNSCYYEMFGWCTNLKSVRCMATNISAYNCTKLWMNKVPTNGTFTKSGGFEGWSRGEDGIPTGWTVEDDDSKLSCGLVFSTDHLDVTYGEPYEVPTLTNPNELSVSYTSSNPTVAMVDATTGELTLLSSGTTTITASFEGSDTYWPGSASYTLTVVGKGDAAEFAFDREMALITYGKTFTAPHLTMSDGLSAKYASDNTSVAIVDATTGKVTIRGKGLATITATTEGSMEYAAASAKYHIAVLENAEKVRCDTNADGNVSITDAVTIVNYILGGGASAPAMEEPKELGPEVAPE